MEEAGAKVEHEDESQLNALLGKLTLEEKVSLASGRDLWATASVPRLELPSLKVTDGPCGARGSEYLGRHPSNLYPAGVALAATWSPALIERVGLALARDTKAKGAQAHANACQITHQQPHAPAHNHLDMHAYPCIHISRINIRFTPLCPRQH